MGQYRSPKPVKLIMGMLSQSAEHASLALKPLIERFGEISTSLSPFPFNWTNYYEDELGDTPVRSFISFESLIQREHIVEIKRWTNDLELELFNGGVRKVNIDPGYMTLGQYFLPTTKDQRHRVYVRDGIFIEPTLYFQDGSWHHFDWTYFDYRSDIYLDFFLETRKALRQDLKGL